MARRVVRKLRRLPVTIGYFKGPLVMSWLRRRWVLFPTPHANIEFGRHTYLGPRFSLHMPYGGTFITGEGVEFRRGFRAEIGPKGRVEIGKHSYFTYDAIIACSTSITIGERCGIGQDCYIIDGSHRFRDLTK